MDNYEERIKHYVYIHIYIHRIEIFHTNMKNFYTKNRINCGHSYKKKKLHIYMHTYIHTHIHSAFIILHGLNFLT